MVTFVGPMVEIWNGERGPVCAARGAGAEGDRGGHDGRELELCVQHASLPDS